MSEVAVGFVGLGLMGKADGAAFSGGGVIRLRFRAAAARRWMKSQARAQGRVIRPPRWRRIQKSSSPCCPTRRT